MFSHPVTAKNHQTETFWVSVDLWWIPIGGQLKYSERIPSHCHLVYHKSKIKFPGIERRSPRWGLDSKSSGPCYGWFGRRNSLSECLATFEVRSEV